MFDIALIVFISNMVIWLLQSLFWLAMGFASIVLQDVPAEFVAMFRPNAVTEFTVLSLFVGFTQLILLTALYISKNR